MASGVKFKFEGLRHIRKRLKDTSGPVDQMFKDWGEKYLGFVKRRFNKFSKGGGDWRKLDPATVRARRKGGKRKSGKRKRAKKETSRVAILADTGILKGGLTVGKAGNLFKRTRKGIRVGFGGLNIHPETKGLTIKALAVIHDQGLPKKGIPQRQILVKPDERLKRRMKSDLRRTIKLIGQEAEQKL